MYIGSPIADYYPLESIKLILPIGQIFYRMAGEDFEQAPLRPFQKLPN
jgi:hypothetical protein